MIAIKKDFIDENTESHCAKGHKLSSGKAYYLRDKHGNKYYGGKQCAEKQATNDLNQIPDLTKSLISRREGCSTTGGCPAGNKNEKNLEISKAITYILLREEKLLGYRFFNKSLSYPPLFKYYEKYKSENNLQNDEIKHILNIEGKSSKKISLKNLSTCYAYQYILERTLACLEKKENEAGIRYTNDLLNGKKGLKQYCNLTKEQINGLSKWLQFLPKDLREAKLKKFDV